MPENQPLTGANVAFDRPHALQFKNSSMKIEHFPLPQGGATVTEAPLQGIWVERAFGAQVQEDVEPGRWM